MTNDLLIVFDEKNVAAIFKKGGVAPYLKDVRERALSILPADVATEEGRKELKSIARRVASSKVALDEAGKTLVADIKKQVGEIDEERKLWRDEMDKLRDEIKKPADDWDAQEKKRIDDHEALLSQLANITSIPAGTTSEQIKERQDRMQAYVERDWQEFKEKSDTLITQKALDLDALYKEKKAAEDQAVENARLKKEKEERDAKDLKEANERAQKERDAKIASDAVEAERLKIEKEKEELAQKQAALSALPSHVGVTESGAQFIKPEKIEEIVSTMPQSAVFTVSTGSAAPEERCEECDNTRQEAYDAVRRILDAHFPDEKERTAAAAIEIVTSIAIGSIEGLESFFGADHD